MQKIVWRDDKFDGVKAVKLFESPGSKEIRINLQKGSMMKEHKAPYGITVQVLAGKIEFSVRNDIEILNSLDMVALDANISHALKALEDSIVRLSLSKNDNISRVLKVLNA